MDNLYLNKKTNTRTIQRNFKVIKDDLLLGRVNKYILPIDEANEIEISLKKKKTFKVALEELKNLPPIKVKRPKITVQ